MKLPRLITRRRLKWAGLGAISVLLAVSCVSLWHGLVLARLDRSNFTWVQVMRGSVSVMWMRDDQGLPPRFVVRHSTPERFHIQAWFDWETIPDTSPNGRRLRLWYVEAPLWLPLLLIAAPTAYLWRTDRRAKPWQCPKCRYDLRGLDGGVCPECGHELKPSNAAGVVD